MSRGDAFIIDNRVRDARSRILGASVGTPPFFFFFFKAGLQSKAPSDSRVASCEY